MKAFLCTIPPSTLLLDKRPYYADAVKTELELEIFMPCDIMNPVLKLQNQYATGFNYMYLPTWGKYYFLDDATILNGEFCSMPARMDVLTSNADEIKNLHVRVVRYEEQRNKTLQDSKMPKSGKIFTRNLKFSSTPFVFPDYAPGGIPVRHYVLSVVGGNGVNNG